MARDELQGETLETGKPEDAALSAAEASAHIPNGRASPQEIDVDALGALTEALDRHDRLRSEPGCQEGDARKQMLDAVCRFLVRGMDGAEADCFPHELAAESDALPEARVCAVRAACTGGAADSAAASELASLLGRNLWPPVQWVAFLALAGLGQRRTLADLLPQEGPLNLAQADAWLEASHAEPLSPEWVGRVECPEWEGLSPEDIAHWTALLKAETQLALGERLDAGALAETALSRPNAPGTYSEAIRRRFAARAAAAQVRAEIAEWGAPIQSLASPAMQGLPQWEREHLAGLAQWQARQWAEAEAALRRAVELAPLQAAPRCALSAFLAARSPEEVLAFLDFEGEATREMLCARACLLARMQRYEDAESAIAGSDGASGECARLSWAAGRRQTDRCRAALKAALAQRRGDWAGAKAARAEACAAGEGKALRLAWELFAAQDELDSIAEGRGWRADVLKNQVESSRHRIGRSVMVGDAAFFRGAALLKEDPQQAAKDFRSLLRRREWCASERRAGGARLIFIGDALRRMGLDAEALRAYESAGDSGAGRAALMQLCAALQGGAIPQEAEDTVARVAGLFPENATASLLAAAASLAAGVREGVEEHLAEAERLGAPAAACRCLRGFLHAADGKATLDEGDLRELGLPESAAAVVRFMGADGDGAARLKALIDCAGEKWAEVLPGAPESEARRALHHLCEQGEWDRAQELAEAVGVCGAGWAAELAALVGVRHALSLALAGEFEEAEAKLQRLAAP